MSIELVRATQTCIACPSQWDAWDAEGNYYYLRYRSGHGEMRQYQSADWVDAPWKDSPDDGQPGWALRANTEYVATVATFSYGDPLDGVITLADFAAHAGITLAPALVETGYADHLLDELVIRGVLPLEEE